MTTRSRLVENALSFRAVIALGISQILMWGGSFFLMPVLARPVIQDTGWSAVWVHGSLSLSIFVSGVLAPLVGRWINRVGGIVLIQYSGMLIGLGLIVMACASSLPFFVVGWGIIGIGMAVGLYDALFATLTHQYGTSAKRIIVQITLIAGLCTTVMWPLLNALIQMIGWRSTCGLYGVVLGCAIWPLTTLGLPQINTATAHHNPLPQPIVNPTLSIDPVLYRLLAVHWTLGASIMTMMSVQLLSILHAKGIASTTAIGVSTLVGPCQIGIRGLEALRSPHHPIGSAIGSAFLMAAGCGLFLGHSTLAVGGVVCYSLGNGLRTILRGTLPLALFDSQCYPVILGSLATPAAIAQALTPLVSAYLMQQYGISAILGLLIIAGMLNLAVTVAMKLRLHHVNAE